MLLYYQEQTIHIEAAGFDWVPSPYRVARDPRVCGFITQFKAATSKLIFTPDVRKSGSADIFHTMSRDTGSTLRYVGIGEDRGVARCRSVGPPVVGDGLRNGV